MQEKAFQDFYPDEFSHCYGCGRLNEHGHKIKSRWDGEESVAFYTPDGRYIALPGFVYGGLIASLVDCHGTGTASAASYRKEGRPMDSEPALRFVTASLKVDFLAPTPMGTELELRGRAVEIKEKKVVVEIKVLAGKTLCATGTVVAVRMPAGMMAK
jgi:acyl-coenzyme A thioesterase PaaI-like protein